MPGDRTGSRGTFWTQLRRQMHCLACRASFQWETLPDDISQLTEELIHSDLLADFQVKVINEWRAESTAQRNNKRHHAQPLRLRNFPPNMLESLWGRPEFSDLIRRGGMGQMVSSYWLVASRHQV